MSVTFIPMVLMAGGFFGYILAYNYYPSNFIAVPVGALSAILAALMWWYSPIPHHNGGFGMPPARKQKWGFTTEPIHDDHKPLDEYEYNPMLSASLGGIFYAEREDDE